MSKKENRSHWEYKVICRWHGLVYREFTKNQLKLINDFIKSAWYKINTQKSIAFLNSSNQQSENEIKKIIPFKTALK